MPLPLSVCEERSKVSLPRGPNKTGRLVAAPHAFMDAAGRQFGTGAFGFGGKAEFTWVPRRRSSAMCRALSFFGSGGT